MNNNILVSVIMSVYNTPSCFLIEAIESIINQSYSEWEFFIFDDNSTDSDTISVLNKYSEFDKRIVLIRNKENRGLTYNLNRGVSLSNGDYICRQDSDDISLPDRIKKQVEYLETHHNIDMLCTAYYIQCSNNLRRHRIGARIPEAIKARLFFENSFIMHSSVMMRAEFLKANDLNYNVEIKKSQDFDLWTRISAKGSITILPEYLCVYRVHNGQISTEKHSKKEQNYFYCEILKSQLRNHFHNCDEETQKRHVELAIGHGRTNPVCMFKWVKSLLQSESISKDFHKKYFRKELIRHYIKYCINYILKR